MFAQFKETNANVIQGRRRRREQANWVAVIGTLRRAIGGKTHTGKARADGTRYSPCHFAEQANAVLN